MKLPGPSKPMTLSLPCLETTDRDLTFHDVEGRVAWATLSEDVAFCLVACDGAPSPNRRQEGLRVERLTRGFPAGASFALHASL